MTAPRAITVKTLRDTPWVHVYRYSGLTLSFTTYASEALPGVTITHEVTLKPKRKRIIYSVNGVRTDSPTQAVRLYNEQSRQKAAGSGYAPPGSPKSSGRPNAGKGTFL